MFQAKNLSSASETIWLANACTHGLDGKDDAHYQNEFPSIWLMQKTFF